MMLSLSIVVIILGTEFSLWKFVNGEPLHVYLVYMGYVIRLVHHFVVATEKYCQNRGGLFLDECVMDKRKELLLQQQYCQSKHPLTQVSLFARADL